MSDEAKKAFKEWWKEGISFYGEQAEIPCKHAFLAGRKSIEEQRCKNCNNFKIHSSMVIPSCVKCFGQTVGTRGYASFGCNHWEKRNE